MRRSRSGTRRTDLAWETVYRDSLRWGIDDVVASGQRIVVVGRAMVNEGAEDDATATLTSRDGRTWQRSLGWFIPMNVYPQTAAIGGRTAVFLGQTTGRGFPLGWRAMLAR